MWMWTKIFIYISHFGLVIIIVAFYTTCLTHTHTRFCTNVPKSNLAFSILPKNSIAHRLEQPGIAPPTFQLALHYEIQPPHKNTLLDLICHWVQDRHQDEVDSCMLPSTYEYVAIFFSLCVYVFNIIFWGDWQVGISLAVQTSSKNESNYWVKGNYLDIWHVSIQLFNVGLFFQH